MYVKEERERCICINKLKGYVVRRGESVKEKDFSLPLFPRHIYTYVSLLGRELSSKLEFFFCEKKKKTTMERKYIYICIFASRARVHHKGKLWFSHQQIFFFIFLLSSLQLFFSSFKAFFF